MGLGGLHRIQRVLRHIFDEVAEAVDRHHEPHERGVLPPADGGEVRARAFAGEARRHRGGGPRPGGAELRGAALAVLVLPPLSAAGVERWGGRAAAAGGGRVMGGASGASERGRIGRGSGWGSGWLGVWLAGWLAGYYSCTC